MAGRVMDSFWGAMWWSHEKPQSKEVAEIRDRVIRAAKDLRIKNWHVDQTLDPSRSLLDELKVMHSIVHWIAKWTWRKVDELGLPMNSVPTWNDVVTQFETMRDLSQDFTDNFAQIQQIWGACKIHNWPAEELSNLVTNRREEYIFKWMVIHHLDMHHVWLDDSSSWDDIVLYHNDFKAYQERYPLYT